ncbi:MAG: hypothetical protein HUJ63_08300 [Enterococcus sp.]|nr:hypothetical protein [Enterococcus sp.]
MKTSQLIRKTSFAIVLISCVVFLVSCNKTESQVKDYAIKVVNALNSGDNETIHNFYAQMAEEDNFAKGMNPDSIVITSDNNTNGYKVQLGDGKYFIVTGEDSLSFKIVASRGLVTYPPELIDKISQTGAITQNMDDSEIGKVIRDHKYMKFLNDLARQSLMKNLKTDIEFGFPIHVTVTNKTSMPVRGVDYEVGLSILSFTGYSAYQGVKPGQDIKPGESIKIRFDSRAIAELDYNSLIFKENLTTKKLSEQDAIMYYLQPQGNEYKNYLNTK